VIEPLYTDKQCSMLNCRFEKHVIISVSIFVCSIWKCSSNYTSFKFQGKYAYISVRWPRIEMRFSGNGEEYRNTHFQINFKLLTLSVAHAQYNSIYFKQQHNFFLQIWIEYFFLNNFRIKIFFLITILAK